MAAENDDSPKVNPLDYWSRTEWYGNATTPGMSDPIWDVDQETFDAALARARAKGSPTRVAVARELGWTPPTTRRTRRNKSAYDRGRTAAARMLADVDPSERDEWIAGVLREIEGP